MKHKLVFVFLLLGALVWSAPALAQDEEIVLDFYYPAAVSGPLQEAFERYAASFTEMHPNVSINVVFTGSYGQTRETVRTEIEGGGAGPDVAVMLSVDLYSFIEDGTIISAQQYIDLLEDPQDFVDDFFPAFMLNSVDAEGNVWTLPFQRSTPILYYNKEHFAEVGLDPEQPPRNLDELIEFAELLTNDERDGIQIPLAGDFPSWLFQSFAIAHGQNLVSHDPTEAFLNTEATKASLAAIQELGDRGVMPVGGSAWDDTPTNFIAGAASMIYHTTGSLTFIRNNATFEFGTGFLPSGPPNEDGEGYGAPTGGGNVYIFDNGTHSEAELQAAWEWAVHLASADIQADWTTTTGYIATRPSAWESEALQNLVAEWPQYTTAPAQLQYADKEIATYRSIDVQVMINTVLSDIISGNESDPDLALEIYQEQIDSLLEPYRGE